MKFVWAGKRRLKNTKLVFLLDVKKDCNLLRVCAADFFRIFGDDKFLAFGPDRTAAGYSVVKELQIQGIKSIRIEVTGYNVNSYACDRQFPFFAAETLNGGNIVYTTDNFLCFRDLSFDEKTQRFSPQRGFIEKYDFRKKKLKGIKTYGVSAPQILSAKKDVCSYERMKFEFIGQGRFEGVPDVCKLKWLKKKGYRTCFLRFDTDKDFIKKTKEGYFFKYFKLPEEHTGFIALNVNAEKGGRFFIITDELEMNEDFMFRRSGCNDIIVLDLPEGESRFLSFEPYSVKYLKVIYKSKSELQPELVLLENSKSVNVEIVGDEKLNKIIQAARSTFNQNAVDIFMDCPSRERAGWLCDSYFTGMSENLFLKSNMIEKFFLRNFIIAENPELERGMMPKCFPSEHKNTVKSEGRNNLYIPNWAMFFVAELYEYYKRTDDKEFVLSAKKKVYELIDFFDKYVNEFGLLEDLAGWVFIEWSDCNKKERLCGVNFPTNILFAHMLRCAGELYEDETLSVRAEKVKTSICLIGFNGKFFVDNAVRVNGVLTPCNDHISETCQYYALYFGITKNADLSRTMIENFGVTNKNDKYYYISPSNMFIGNYLRLFWLCELNENKRVLEESKELFYRMAAKTGTLWEHNDTRASCNHGFASVIAVLLLRSICGFEEIKNGKTVFKKDFKNGAGDGLKVIYDGKPLC